MEPYLNAYYANTKKSRKKIPNFPDNFVVDKVYWVSNGYYVGPAMYLGTVVTSRFYDKGSKRMCFKTPIMHQSLSGSNTDIIVCHIDSFYVHVSEITS